MAVVVMLGSSIPKLQAVRDQVNRAARRMGASDATRRDAVGKALTLVRFGHSPAWAISEACRQLAGKPTLVLHRGPTPPEAA